MLIEEVPPKFIPGYTRVTTDDGHVLRVIPDEGVVDCPLDERDGVAAHTLHAGRFIRPHTHTSNDPVVRAFLRAYDRDEDGMDDDAAVAFAQRYARIFHGDDRAVEVHTISGHAQSDWETILIVAPADEMPALITAYRQWFQGDVWVVAPEDASVVALGGIYADDAEGAVRFYLDNA